MSSSTDNPIPTENFLLPGQGFCIGLPWERAELPKHGLPSKPLKPLPTGNVLDQEAELEGDPCAGWEIGRCEVIRRLTPGSAKRLLALRHDEGGSDVVDVRQLDVSDGDGPQIEAYADDAGRLRHSSLARVFPCEVSDEGVFWVSERVSGATLAELMVACRARGKGLPLGLGLAAIHEAALALSEVHSRMAHGLISNHAVAVGFDGVTKLLDAGLFQVLARKRSWGEVLEITGPYLAPEQVLNGRLPDPKADLYSLGILLYECLSGEAVRRTASFEERVKVMERGQLTPPSSLNVMVGKSLDEVVFRALATDRTQRYQSAADFAQELKRASSSFMWRTDARAQFVSELFSTRNRREQALTAHLAPRRRRTTSVREVSISQVIEAIEPVSVSSLPPVVAPPPLPKRVMMPAANPAVRSAQLKDHVERPSRAVGLAHLLGTVFGVGLGFAATLVAWGQVPVEASGYLMPLSREAPVHPVVFEEKPVVVAPIVDGEMSREVTVLASVGPLVAAVIEKPVAVLKRGKPKRTKRDEAPVPAWLSGPKRRR